jgi:diguanylate cyclase (GGDEF)-like protein
MTSRSTRPTRILVVETDDRVAVRIASILEETDSGSYDVDRATSVVEAARHLDHRTADCAVVNAALFDPERGGILEALAAHPSAPVVIALLDGTGTSGAAAIDAGADDYLTLTSLTGELLVRTISAVLARRHLETSLAVAEGTARMGSWHLDMVNGALICSPEMRRLFAFGPDDRSTYDALSQRIHPDDRDSTIETMTVMVEAGSPFFVEHRIMLPDETIRWIRTRGLVEMDRDGRPERLVGTAQDITEDRAAEDALFLHTFHDPLTGLPNRQLFLDRLNQVLTRMARQPSVVGVIYLDIDRFKRVNDSLGPSVGDQLLQALALRFTALARQQDTVARIGADEFVILCEGLSGEDEAVAIAERICAAMTEPLPWADGELVISVCSGIALAASASISANALLRDADAAMHRAKGQGLARTAVFSEIMRTNSVGTLDTEISLREAIALGALQLHYQPIVALSDGTILGHEALVRWAHPTRGLIGPDQFIPVAEETGLIVPLGTWVLMESCRQAKRFQARHPRWSDLTMSVNLSGGQLGQPDLLDLVASALHDSDLAPEHLQLEMTESVLMDDAATTITILEALKGLDVLLGVDDFGTGYSSLAYLRRFPVDVLKIDRSFVNGLPNDLEDTAIVATIVSLAETLGLVTIAEGVETTVQRDCLISLSCPRAQGFLFARPVTAEEAAATLDRVTSRLEARSASPAL